MKRSLLWIVSTLTLAALFALLPVTAAAQTIWTSPDRTNNIAVEWFRPDFDNATGLSFLTSGLFLSGRVALSDNLRFVADLPFAFYNADADFAGRNESDVAVGNPYLGLELGGLDRPLWGEVGLRLPLTPSDNHAVGFGFLSDYDRCEAFMADMLSVVGVAHYQYRHDAGFSLRLRGGPLFQVHTNPDEFEDRTEIFAIYSLQGWYDTARMRFGAGVTGRLLATESNLDFGERSVHHLGLAVAGKFRGVEPGLHFRVPVDKDLSNVMNYVLGITVTVPFGQR